MDLTIVIINWNGIKVLRNCLHSLFSSPQGIEFEVIVVDNASQDDSVAVIRQEFPLVRLILNTKNLGFAAANNQGFAQAQGRHVLLLNNDTIVLAGALEKSIRHMDAHPKIGALGCRVEFPDRSFQTSCYRFMDLTELFMVKVLPIGSVRNERFNYARYWGAQFTAPTEVDVVAGCYMLVRREVIQSVGGLDEEFFMYGEDEEWCSRIKQAGWQIVYEPSATIIHLHRFSSSQARRALRVIELMSPVLVLHKRRGPFVAWAANIILLLGFLLRFPFWLVLDIRHRLKGTAQSGLIASRFVALGTHLLALVWPVWKPKPRA